MAERDEQKQFFANRLSKRFKHLWRYAKRIGTDAFRVYHRDIPELPFSVDWYAGHLHIAEFDRPHERSPEEHAAWVDEMVAVAARALGVADERVFVKRRERNSGTQQYERVAERGYTVDVTERDLIFRVNLSDYVDTGLFLDHRDLRYYVGTRSAGRRMLNLFCYTGSFTVYAAAGMARSTVSIDLSNTYLAWARTNLDLNGLFSPDHDLVRADARASLDQMARARERFDIIVLDPPSFSNSRAMEGTLDIQRDHVALINTAMTLLKPGGELVFSTNRRRFQLSRDRLKVGEVHRLTKSTMPEDFRDTGIHLAWSFRP